MAEYSKGEFKCIFEDISATDAMHLGKKRIVSVESKIKRVGLVLRGAAPNPLIGSIKEYLAGAPALLKIGYNNGHLIGLKLGGPDDAYNIAPMFGSFNEVAYRRLERALYDDSSIQYMRVRVVYDAEAHALPVAFHIDVKKAATEGADPATASYMPYDIMLMAVPSARPYPFDGAVRDRIAAVLPTTKPTVEPYAFLDGLGIGASPTETSEYTEIQKQHILTANALYGLAATGEAMLCSDDPSDPIQTLNIFGGDDRPQVDHVIPRSASGGNSFRNAMVLSKRLNGIKSAKLDEELMAVLRAARDPRPRRGASALGTAALKDQRKAAAHPYGRPPK